MHLCGIVVDAGPPQRQLGENTTGRECVITAVEKNEVRASEAFLCGSAALREMV